MKKIIKRHKNCGGYILPDIENSFTGMVYSTCPKCRASKLTSDDFTEAEEDIDVFVIMNADNDYLQMKNDGDDDHIYTITFETKDMAKEFATKHGIPEDSYRIERAAALYGGETILSNGTMVTTKESD